MGLFLTFAPSIAVSTPAPVTLNLPSGWTANPALAQMAPIVWARSASQGGETLSAIAIPVHGLPPAVVMARIQARLAPPNTPIWKTQATLCGAPGLGISGHSSGSFPETEYVVEQSGATLYLFVYARATGVVADAQTENFMRTACPASASAVPSLVPPAGWTAKTLLANLAAWQRDNGDSVVLATTSLAEAGQLASALKSQPNSDVKPQTYAACGGTGFQSEQEGNVGAQSFRTTEFLIMTHQTAYVIYYRHALAADPAVVAAIRAFCPADASTVGLR